MVFAALANSCKSEPISTVKKGEIEVEFLFENDGCKLYRFADGINRVYYSDCSGKASYDTGGKNSQHIETLNN